MAKILIIEDEKAMSDLIAIKFKVEGFEVDQAFSLADAKTKLAAGGYQAILADYLLPDGNSFDLFSSMPQVTASTPTILATNYIEDLSQEKAKQLGIKEVIVKYQVVPAQMVEKVKGLVGATPQPTTPPVAQAAPVPSQPAPTPVVPPTPAPSTPPVAQAAAEPTPPAPADSTTGGSPNGSQQ